MPTSRPRHTLTETDDLALALDDAALRWPELRDDRTALLKKLVDAGRGTLNVDGGVRRLIRESAGAATGAYPRGARSELLGEWPE